MPPAPRFREQPWSEPGNGRGAMSWNEPDAIWTTIDRRGSEVHVAVHGDLDLFTADFLRRTITGELERATPATPIYIDLGHCTFMDAAGLHALINSRRNAVASQVTLCVS